MAITASSTTALDVPSLVSQLMAVERQPIDKFEAKVSSYEAKISSFGTLSSLVSTFQTAAKGLSTSLQKATATPSDTSALSATAGSSAVPGNYTVNVSQLAQSHNLVAAGQTSSTAAIGDGTATTVTFDLGTISGGTLTNGIYSGAAFTSNGSGTASITIDGTNNTLEGIRDAINAADLGVTATLVNDGSGTPYRLALASSSSGASNSIKITTSGGDGAIDSLLGYDPAGTQNLSQTLAAQNASLTVNGIAITSASNTVSEAVQGVTLTLKNTGNVGIGTWSPEYDLEVVRTGENPQVVAHRADGAYGFLSATDTAAQIGSLTDAPLELVVNGVTRATLDNDGTLSLGPYGEFSAFGVTTDFVETPVIYNDTGLNVRIGPTIVAQWDGAGNMNLAGGLTATTGIGSYGTTPLALKVNGTTKALLDVGGNLTIEGALTEASDVNRKQNFCAVDQGAVLSRIASLPWGPRRSSSARRTRAPPTSCGLRTARQAGCAASSCPGGPTWTRLEPSAALLELDGRVEHGGAEADPAQRVHLVLHERDERRDDQHRSGQDPRRDLEGERLARAGRHHRDAVAPREHGVDDEALPGAELPEAEDALEHLLGIGGPGGGRGSEEVGQGPSVDGGGRPPGPEGGRLRFYSSARAGARRPSLVRGKGATVGSGRLLITPTKAPREATPARATP